VVNLGGPIGACRKLLFSKHFRKGPLPRFSEFVVTTENQ
jgi:hypothetical protein